ncbi:hypothetical protein [Streptomyces justiciae]|uniref:hypothetical protein n=1 Tax=Streptomyces justiciae TaxID=2780140 RepID=UPI001881FF82|nr:hypothetical protein [Streptomyces justiciae]MBE8473277.1 hypothetical protein [Streptomyces justiciae]MCW8384005.1 hypothetical protein [Streptomyces justiciae]
MRLSRSLAPIAVAAVLLMSLPHEASPHAREDKAPDLFGAACYSKITGSHVTAYCHNPYPDVDRVRLHIECDRWWDVDSDSAPVEAGPAQTVRLDGRCWKEVRSAWVSHQKR